MNPISYPCLNYVTERSTHCHQLFPVCERKNVPIIHTEGLAQQTRDPSTGIRDFNEHIPGRRYSLLYPHDTLFAFWTLTCLIFLHGFDDPLHQFVAEFGRRKIPQNKISYFLDVPRPTAVGQKSIHVNFVIPFRQNMKQKPPDEFLRGQFHGLPFAFVFIVPVLEGHLAVVDGQNPMVGNGDAVRVSSDVQQHLGRTRKRPLGEDVPEPVRRPVDQHLEQLLVGKLAAGVRQHQPSAVVRLFQKTDELSTEQI